MANEPAPKDGDLLQIFYTCRTTTPLDEAALLDHFKMMADNFEPHGVRSVLLYNNGYFAQNIEGPEEAVNDFFSGVEKDASYTNVMVLARHNIPSYDIETSYLACAKPADSEELSNLTQAWVATMEKRQGSAEKSPGFVLSEALWAMHKTHVALSRKSQG